MAREVLGVAGAAIGGFFGGPVGAQFGFMVGSIIGGIVDPINIDGPKLGDASVQTSRDGIPIPIGWGTVHVVGNIIQMNPIVETTRKVRSGKGGPTTTETTRTRTFAIGICRGIDGPITGILRCWENNKLIYDVRSGSTFTESDNTAFEAATTVYLGDETQVTDPDLEANTGVGNTPAYRGLPYIVWKNKDITEFGSSIPSYRFEINVTGSSGVFGTTATQNNYWIPSPSHAHPFEGQVFSEYTVSSVFQANSSPVFGDSPRGPFGIGGKKLITLNWRSGSGVIYLHAQLYSYPLGSVVQIASDAVDLDSVGDGTKDWSPLDWYCVTISYSQPLNTCKVAYVNLTRAEEVVQTAFMSNNVDVDFFETGDGDANSTVTWGATHVRSGTPFGTVWPWKGALGHSFAHNKYADLGVAASRRLFSGLDGIISLGFQGELPFNEQALIYLPTGHPSDQLGSADIGIWSSDFFFDGISYVVEETPPPAGNGPTVDTTGSVTWEAWFGSPFDAGFVSSRAMYMNEQVIPDAGIAIAFTIPQTTRSYTVSFFSIASINAPGTRTGSVNQIVGDYTSPPTYTWGLDGGIICGINNPGLDLDLLPGYTYFFNIRNNTPSAVNMMNLQAVIVEQ